MVIRRAVALSSGNMESPERMAVGIGRQRFRFDPETGHDLPRQVDIGRGLERGCQDNVGIAGKQRQGEQQARHVLRTHMPRQFEAARGEAAAQRDGKRSLPGETQGRAVSAERLLVFLERTLRQPPAPGEGDRPAERRRDRHQQAQGGSRLAAVKCSVPVQQREQAGLGDEDVVGGLSQSADDRFPARHVPSGQGGADQRAVCTAFGRRRRQAPVQQPRRDAQPGGTRCEDSIPLSHGPIPPRPGGRPLPRGSERSLRGRWPPAG